MGKEYKWDSPLDWLTDRITNLLREGDTATLARDFRQLAEIVDGDAMQDLFQSDMQADGYFQPLQDTPEENE